MTSKELSFLKDILGQEEQVIKKCQTYAEHVDDQAIKNLCLQTAAKHECNYKTIYSQLNS